MADAEPEAEDGSEDGGGGGGGRAPPGQGGTAARVAPLGPEQLRQVLEQVTKAQPPAEPPPPPFVLQDAARRLRDAAQQAALQRVPGAEPSRPPRLLPPQQLEAICVKVTSAEMKDQERPMPPLPTIQPKPALSQLPARTSRVVGPRPQPLLSSGPRPCFLSSSLPVQLLAQGPLPALQPLVANGPGAIPAPSPAPDPPALASVSPSPANFFLSGLHTKHTKKLKKSLKVKTRSGRISRPPKYKAKDYKFIKTEDLADGHLSDSDDYSELSVEDDDEQREKQMLFDLSGCSLRPKTFKCQTCEKSYIGKGGLARHLKLNPSHGRLEPEVLLSEKANGTVTRGRTAGLTSPEPSTPALQSEEGAQSPGAGPQNSQSLEVEEALVSEPENGSYSALLGSERHPDSRSDSSVALMEASTAVVGRSRAAHPAKGVRAAGVQSASRARAGLKEVETGHLAKPLFPAVYKEFEELHKMVKKMCQDYLSGAGLCSREPLEISNSKVAESLGLTEFLRKQEAHSWCGEPGPAEVEDACQQKRGHETAEEGLAWAKRTRREAPAPALASPEPPANRGGPQKPPTCAPAASEGCAPYVSGNGCYDSAESHTTLVSKSDRSVLPADQQLKALADLEAKSGSAAPALSYQHVGRPSLCPPLEEPRTQTQGQVAAFPEENVPEHSVAWKVGDSLRPQALCSTLTSTGGADSLPPSGSGSLEMQDSPQRGQRSSPSHILLMEDTGPPPARVLSVDTELANCARRTVRERGLGQVGSPSSDGGQGSQAGDSHPFPCGPEACADQRGLESIIAVGEAVAFEITHGCHELLPQGQEPLFIQSSDGLILSHPASLASGEEDLGLVAGVDGPALHAGPREGVPPEGSEAEAAQ
ncbi:zinc finger protein 839 isoform X2 [Lutra lutra]|uniref:zinc finger protein 839 isoform X2 n=1 Tax=Lutra lutra TaxID=9657 RepID=UPI001FD42A54|nr:zinc finger protein 839 isoform X2 [Lutra lutra]